jgi:uncharacterized membrane-anchored protein YjiN (DUF445 family)
MALLSPADQERLRGLRRMKAVALGALIFMAVVFVLAFWFEHRLPWLSYVRAAAEGGMVGALADWFAVTALFRHPLGLPIPHTAIIPNRKDEIGRTLGEWMQQPAHAERVTAEASTAASAVLRALSDDDVQGLIADLAREHLIAPDWAPSAGGWLERIVEADAHRGAVDLAVDSISTWLDANAHTFSGLVSRRLPSWVPRLAHRFVDETVYHEAQRFVQAVQADPQHPARRALDGYLARLADRLQNDGAMRDRFEGAKAAVFDSPRVISLAAEVWDTAKNGLLAALADPDSGLRRRAASAVAEIGNRLATEPALQARVDGWVTDAADFLVDRYRHDIASIITDTVEKWDAAETTEKIELMVGRDLQYIRLNGTVVGALAGAVIFAVAHAVIPVPLG